MSSIIYFDILIDRSESKKVVEVGFHLLRLSFWYIEYGSKLTLASRSSKAHSILWSSVMQGIDLLETLYNMIYI